MIMDLVWDEMESATGVMQFMIPDAVSIIPRVYWCTDEGESVYRTKVDSETRVV